MNARDLARFNSKVAPPNENGCTLWTAAPGPDGYGRFWLDGKTQRAHRVSYEFNACEDIPPGHDIRHSCDVRLCVNPDHLSTVAR